MKPKLIFLNSHPIQYFAPLYQAIVEDSTFDLEVWYCSQHGLQSERDMEFNTSIKWDIPLLSGYKYFFFKNYALHPSIYSFWGLLNLGIVSKLWYLPRKSIVVVNGWAYFSNFLLFIFGRLFGHTVCLRGESPITLELKRKGWRNALRYNILRRVLFPMVDYFLFLGQQNLRFYKYFGVSVEKMIFTPYAVDNHRFQKEADVLSSQKIKLRRLLGLPENAFILLYSGKFIPKKRPLDLLSALEKTTAIDSYAVFVGEGTLRLEMEEFIKEKCLEKRVLLAGFINQSDIPRYYALSDVYVMCSDEGETWGLSTNEAMNFSLPLLLSNQIGCNPDLLVDGTNGYSYTCGDVDELAQKIDILATETKERLTTMGKSSLQIIKNYSYKVSIIEMKKRFGGT